MTAADGRYSRQVMLPEIGEEGQQKIASSSVLIVGLGGLGSPVSMYLAGAGVGRIGLADPDMVSVTNLQRQILYDVRQTGMLKAEAAAERLSAFSPDTAFETFPTAVTGDNAMSLVEKYDVVVDCCDNFTTRYILDEVCSACGRPLVFGAIGEYSGQVTVLDGRAGKRLSDLYPDRESLCSRPVSVSGVIGPVPGVIGSIQACETLKLLAGFGELLDGRLFVIDLLTLRSDIVDF